MYFSVKLWMIRYKIIDDSSTLIISTSVMKIKVKFTIKAIGIVLGLELRMGLGLKLY